MAAVVYDRLALGGDNNLRGGVAWRCRHGDLRRSGAGGYGAGLNGNIWSGAESRCSCGVA